MIYEAASWALRQIGFVPIAEAIRQEEFENTLAMLYPTEEDREEFRQAALMLAKVGASYEDLERAARTWALGYDPAPPC